MTQGKLIVFEGNDGSGKGTQMSLFVETLKKRLIPFATMDFPRYNESFFGDLAGRMLRGDFGGIDAVPPELAVLPYACDRWLIRDDVNRWISEGKLVISNRYTASSAVYQAAKLPKEKQQPFIDWVYTLEQEVIGLPKETLVIYFYMPTFIAKSLVEKKGTRQYLGNKKKDIYEESDTVQATVDELYRGLASLKANWKTIDCVCNNQLRTPEEIQKDLLDVLTQNRVL